MMGFTLVGFLLLFVFRPGITLPQETKVLNLDTEPIPKNYRSWSLFLICNPQWLLAGSEARLANLYEHFNAFGDAIGEKHLAVWFTRRPPTPERSLAKDLDVKRNAALCTKLKLLPSNSPYVVVMNSYPDVAADNLKYEVLIQLNNLPPDDIGNLLTKLTDQLLVQGLRQTDFDSAQYWGAWRRSVESIGEGLASVIKKVKITINAGPVKLEVEGGTGA
ncbi:MAG: hypothetical protein OEN50_18430 [Deltaproteobacteria bacterium]|nr:hypothetical protein [Deltaproteobacteria bacterium]